MYTLGACLILALAGCTRAPELWRDQYVFVGDDSTVLCVGLDRRATGAAEAKAWIGAGGRWQYVFYDQFVLGDVDPADLGGALARLSGPGTRLRVEVSTASEAPAGTRMRIRLPHAAMDLAGTGPVAVAETVDPEGASLFRASRAELRMGRRSTPGWLVIDTTPPERPKHPYVDYGDFVFLVARLPDGAVLVAKRSRSLHDFDRAFEFGPDGRAPVERFVVRVDLEADAVRVVWDGAAAPLHARVLDVRSSDGRAPDGGVRTYQALLLEGGIAFSIRPASEVN